MKALITGASSGIGKEIALNLAERGIDLVLVGRNSERMYELEKRINGKVDVDIIQIDLSIIG
ncbi:MAG: SDR family NAD(P)-dependent oxidoreductase, partial [Candidatus Kapaibacterium sp.]